ncbi:MULTISPECIES: cyclophilin-like fold protein [Thermoanaerobacter]|nr:MULTISPECIES: cyclophilin-like fold protein [Thermoanaerobacter]MDP9750073.1 hypothetical protein [Thermoanaerobacter pentosaceus]
MSFTLVACSGNNSARNHSQQEQQPTTSEGQADIENENPTLEIEAADPQTKTIDSRPVESESAVSQSESNDKSTSAGRESNSEIIDNEEDLDAVDSDRIKLTFNNEEVIVKMYDHPTSRDFLTLLPLTLTFRDYAGAEKISELPKRLSTKDAPSGSDPSVGDFAYYSPWGNLAIFYRDSGYASGLIILGKIESGMEKLARINGDFTVTIELLEQRKK